MRTLLLCGYRSPLGLDRCPQGRTLIERRLAALHEYGSPVVAVLSGAFADEQLRQCPRLADVELAYDNSGDNSGDNYGVRTSLTTNVVVGLEDRDREPFFVLPVEIPLPDRDTWNGLLEAAESEHLPEKASLIQAVTPQGAPWHYGFPLVVSRFGNRELRRLKELNSLLDPRLNYLHLVLPNEVASVPKAI